MVMKRNAMGANLRQSILKSLGRYIAIALIIALGAGIFVGLRMTKADMVATGQVYTDELNMFDLRLATSYGWSVEDVDRIAEIEGPADVEGLFYVDLVAYTDDAADESVYRFYTMPQTINQLVLLEGRLPENPNECLADGYRAADDVIGSRVTISENNDEDSLELVNEKTYTVVGLVSSPLYMDMNRGTTSVGSGSLENFFFVPDAAFDVNYYPEIHLTIPGDYIIYSDEYNDAMDDMADYLEPLLQPIADARLEKVRVEAEDAYAEGYAEYLDGVKEYQEGVHEAYEELHDAYQQLLDGEQELEENEQLLLDGQKQLEDAREELEDAEKTVQQSWQALAEAEADAYQQISESTESMTAELEALTEELKTVDDRILQLTADALSLSNKMLPLQAEIAAIEAKMVPIRSMISMLDSNIQAAQNALALAERLGLSSGMSAAALRQQISSLQAKKAEYNSQLAEIEKEKEPYQAQLNELQAQVSGLEAQVAELRAIADNLNSFISDLTTGLLELVIAKAVMEEEFAAAREQLQAAEAQIQAGYRELEEQEQNLADGFKQLEEGRQELADGWEEYRDGSREVDEELSKARKELNDAKIELADARETIDGMTEANLMILDRNTNVGYTSLDSSSDIVAGVSKIFPAFFLLVSALVCITTMTRMVDEERTQIGTLKALGYSNAAIMSKYLIYAGSSAILGCGIGVFAGSMIFPAILWEAYKIMLCITDSIVLTYDWALCLLVVIMFTAVELFVTWYCCRRSLQEVPAELIRPKAPDVGKHLIFEKLPFWNKISFLNKVTIRNIFRYRQRLAMMMVGIGGCTALLLTGFGLRDTIVNIVDFQFDEVTTYDMSVYFSKELTEKEQSAFVSEFASETEDIAFYHQTSVEIDYDNQTRELYMISGGDEIQGFIDFHSGEESIDMPGMDEVVLSVGVCDTLGISKGDEVILRDSDMRTLRLTVSGIYENYVYNYAIVAPETIEKQFGAAPEIQMAFVNIGGDKDAFQIGAEIINSENVMNVSVSEDLADMVKRMMEALDLVVWVIVFCAALLAAVVLYNLTNININERIREIATIKVLGFNATETAMYVFKENLTLSVMGTVGGLLMGKFLLEFVISQIKIDFVWFQARALPPSYLWSVVLTILMAVIVDFVFYFKLETINMAEALKSVE